MLNSKQRAYLRGCANTMDPVTQVGKGGISDALVKTVSDALEARELIKLSVLETSSSNARETADEGSLPGSAVPTTSGSVVPKLQGA